MTRLLFLLHRYLGLAVGALMVMWCLSGVVMMYVSYPELDESNRKDRLTPISWIACCKISGQVAAAGTPGEFQLEMLAGRPVLRLPGARTPRLVDLTSGSDVDRISEEQAAAVAVAYARGVPPPRLLDLIDYDQWTVSGSFKADRPLYRFALNDDEGTEVYISSSTGKAVQLTTGRTRFWNWLGAVPHWLYFAELRRRASLWNQVVIAASVIGCFLAATGIYIGVRQFLCRPAGRFSPYAGFNLWHHAAGLVFGMLALTWVFSGLLSMNPWGWLEGEGAQREYARLRGTDPPGAELRSALQSLADASPSAVVAVDGAVLDGRQYIIATMASGERRRLGPGAVPAPLREVDLARAAELLGGAGTGTATRIGAVPVPSLMTQEDDYYFSHHQNLARLPVYRIILGDGTRYYLDAVSGMLAAKFDRDAQAYRWLHQGLHRMDFAAPLRRRPQWDVVVLALMSGVTLLCATGAYLGYRNLGRGPASGRPRAHRT